MNVDKNERDELPSRPGRRFDAGTILFRQGDPALEAFLLQQGRVRLFKEVGCVERSLRVARPGELFGETALIPGSARNATAVALDDVVALALAPNTLSEVLGSSAPLGTKVLAQLVTRLRDAEDQIEILMLGDAQAKVVVSILKLADNAQRDPRAQQSPSLSLSPLELSAQVGLDVESVKRIVHSLREAGYVRIQNERLEVTNLASLRELYGLMSIKDRLRGGSRRDLPRARMKAP